MLLLVFDYLDLASLSNICRVCKKWREVSFSSSLRRWNHIPAKLAMKHLDNIDAIMKGFSRRKITNITILSNQCPRINHVKTIMNNTHEITQLDLSYALKCDENFLSKVFWKKKYSFLKKLCLPKTYLPPNFVQKISHLTSLQIIFEDYQSGIANVRIFNSCLRFLEHMSIVVLSKPVNPSSVLNEPIPVLPSLLSLDCPYDVIRVFWLFKAYPNITKLNFCLHHSSLQFLIHLISGNCPNLEDLTLLLEAPRTAHELQPLIRLTKLHRLAVKSQPSTAVIEMLLKCPLSSLRVLECEVPKGFDPQLLENLASVAPHLSVKLVCFIQTSRGS